ncbi:carbohydrate-binding family 9-like protein [Paenibacillus mendelii]|uniref:Carbohydrate-binding family 9-like protein n=1 Tax=Paenibacillus mendelii TaxID=206163 RepID=A0ABV6JK01_9BACL|nr:carbohydrate-binding family 9-like protein [Paenibacillus mendelii]MCQ6558947.1 carbohydrate-binding family 9-like protein [Paenibacillus mendelii]
MAEQNYQLACRYVKYDDTVWDTIEETSLVNVVDGGPVQDATGFRACWDDEYLYVRFDCEDDYMVANFTKRDDPLYDEDVVELFIDEAGNGTRYMEFEFSPRNVIFDAMIDNHGESITVDTDWDADGLETEVRMVGTSWIFLMKLPLSHFRIKPENGTAWRVNFYRIDEKRDGKREYQAWSPTGAVNYHIPSRFGTLRFVR